MATHFDDEEDLENLKRWWKENWLALVAGLVIGFGAIGSWQGWKWYHNSQAEAASQIYEDLKKALAASRNDDAVQMADKLAAEYSGTPYAADAALRLAQNAVQRNQFDEAAARLGWVVEHADDEGMKQLAALRKARVLWAQSKPDEALMLLAGKPGAFEALYEELRGDIKLSQGDRAAALSAYEKALASAAEQAPNRELLQQKLDDLADDSAVAAKVNP